MIPQASGASPAELAAVVAESAATTADLAALQALLGALDTIVGPGAPEGYPDDLTAGFVLLITLSSAALPRSAVKAGTLSVSGGATSGTADTGTGWSNQAILAVPNGDLGAGVRWWVTLSGGIVTVTTSAALAGPVSFSYIAFQLGG